MLCKECTSITIVCRTTLLAPLPRRPSALRSQSGAIGPLLRHLSQVKHDDQALRSGLHTLSLIISNSPNRGIIINFKVGDALRLGIINFFKAGSPRPCFNACTMYPPKQISKVGDGGKQVGGGGGRASS